MDKSDDTKVNKEATITIRLSPEWESYIEATAKALTKKMEVVITKTWVVTNLMKMGLPDFEKHHGIERKFVKRKSA
jgi:hypothetical protein